MADLESSPINFFLESSLKYGDIFRLRLGKKPGYFIKSPDLIKEVLKTNQSSFIKEDSFKRTKAVIGEGLLTSEGEYHRRQRRLVQPAFHSQRIMSYGQTMSASAERVISGWRDGKTLNIFQEMTRLTLEIVAKTLFNTDLEDDVKDIGEAMTIILESLPFSISSDNTALLKTKHFEEAKARLDRIIYRLIDERRRSGKDTGDLLSMLVMAADKDGRGGMTDKELHDEALTILLAGHETMATVMTWTWYLISQDQDCQNKLREELDGVLTDGRLPESQDLPRLPYAKKVLTESMRLYPPVWTLGRLAIKDCEIGGYRIQKNSVVLMSQYITHRDPRFFSEPEKFLPDRWTRETKETLPEFAYFPFGGGSRRCIGEQFAWMEGTLLIATIARCWNFELVDDGEVELHPLVTLRPKTDIEMIARRIS